MTPMKRHSIRLDIKVLYYEKEKDLSWFRPERIQECKFFENDTGFIKYRSGTKYIFNWFKNRSKYIVIDDIVKDTTSTKNKLTLLLDCIKSLIKKGGELSWEK